MLYVVNYKKKVIVDAASSAEAVVKAYKHEIIREDNKLTTVKPITNSEKIYYGLKERIENGKILRKL